MRRPQATPNAPAESSDALRDALSRSDAVLDKIAPILGHLLSTPDQSLFSDEIVARVRGMMHDVSHQVLRVQAEATGHAGREEFAARHGAELALLLQGNPAILGHCHALAVEWQLAQRMEGLYALDTVLSPLLQKLIASPDSSVASAAMGALAAQARFAQAQRRMELPLAELPGDLLHEGLLVWRVFNGGKRSDALTRAETKIRGAFDESNGRVSLFARLVAGMGEENLVALNIERAGSAMFLTALAARTGQSRELATLSAHEYQVARLALGLCAAGLPTRQIEAEILRIHPLAEIPDGLADLRPAQARRMLSENAPGVAG